MNMQGMLMQQMTKNNPVIGQLMQMKMQGMTPNQVLQQMAQSNPQIAQIMNGNPNQIAMNLLKEAGVNPQDFINQANNLMR